MKYILKVSSALGVDLVDLDEAFVQRIKTAKRNVTESLSLEEKLDLSLTNYEELEQFISSLSIVNKIFRDGDWNSSTRKKREFSRLFANLLSSNRLYIDHLIHHISRIYGRDSEQFQLIQKKITQCHDESFSYRLLNEIRNHIQRAGLPINYKAMSAWGAERNNMMTIITPTLSIEDIRQNQRFKKSILAELQLYKDNLDLKPHIHNSLEKLIEINQYVRKLLSDDYDKWSSEILLCIEQGEQIHSTTTSEIYTTIYIETDELEVVEIIDVTCEDLKLRDFLCSQNNVIDSTQVKAQESVNAE